MPAPNSTVSQVLSTTFWNFVTNGQFSDNIFDGLRTAQVHIEYGGKQPIDGGENISVQLEYAENSTAGWIGEYGTVDLAAQDVLTAAQFNWRQITGSVILTDLEQVKNAGRSAMASLAKSKLNNLMKSLRTRFNEALFSDGSNALQPAGFRAIISNTGTLGGISRSTNTWWQSNLDSTSTALTVALMRTSYNNATHNLDVPKYITTTQALYEKYESLAAALTSVNVPQANPVVDLGFESLRFKGVPIFWDGDCPSGFMFMVNPDFLRIYCAREWEFRPLPVVRPANQNLEVHRVSWFGNLAPTNSRMHAALSNKT